MNKDIPEIFSHALIENKISSRSRIFLPFTDMIFSEPTVKIECVTRRSASQVLPEVVLISHLSSQFKYWSDSGTKVMEIIQ